MKILLQLLLAVVFFQINAYSQPAIQWQKTFGGTGHDFGTAILQTADSGYMIAGNTNSNDFDVAFNHGNTDVWLVKTDQFGTIEWQNSLGGSGIENVSKIDQTSDGGYILVGSTNSVDGDITDNNGNSNCWVVKIGISGNIEWEYVYYESYLDGSYGTDVKQVGDGGYIISGNVTPSDPFFGEPNSNCLILKLNLSGGLEWQQQYGGNGHDSAGTVQPTADGGYIVVGTNQSQDMPGHHGGALNDIWVLKLNSIGELQWQKFLGGHGNDSGNHIHQSTDGGYMVFGSTSLSIPADGGDVSGNHGGWDFWVVKIDSTGVLEWQSTIGSTLDEIIIDVAPTINNGFVLTGIQGTFVSGSIADNPTGSFYTVKINATGDMLWETTLGGTAADMSMSVNQTMDDGYIIAGKTNSVDGDITSNHGDSDFWIVKLESDPLSIIDHAGDTFNLYPNPASDKIYFRSRSDLTQNASLKIVDISGKVLFDDLVDGDFIDISFLQTGIYLLQLKSGGVTLMKKFVKQ